MRLRSLAVALAAVVLAAPAAHAQTNLSQGFTLSTSSPLVSFSFTVTSGGTFQVFTQAPTIDPVVFLFGGTDVTAPGSFIDRNDDGCPEALCGASGSYANGLITRNLDVGIYTVVGAQCCTSTEMVQGGTASFSGEAPFPLVVRSEQGVATSATSTVPEPGTWALMGTGLRGIAAAARRRRTAA